MTILFFNKSPSINSLRTLTATTNGMIREGIKGSIKAEI